LHDKTHGIVLPRYRCANCILETKTKVGSTAAKAPDPRSDGRARNPEAMTVPPTPKPTRKTEVLTNAPPTIDSSHEEDAALKEVTLPRYRSANCILETTT